MSGPCPFCEITHAVAVPVIHSNGTSAAELRDQIDGALDAMKAAIQAVAKAAPNGRDYYVNDSVQRAIKEHCIRGEKLIEVASELSQICDHIYEVISFQEAHKAREVRR